MTRWIKRMHMYTGLVNLTILIIFGIAGLTATVQPERPVQTSVETHEFQVPANADDFQAASAAFAFLQLPQASPINKNAVRRDADQNVTFTTYSASGPRVVTLLEKERRVRVEFRRNRIWHFLNNLHASTWSATITDRRLEMWTWYTEFSIWSLIFMSLTGVYLWLASRPGYRWAQISFVAGSGAFLALYVLTR